MNNRNKETRPRTRKLTKRRTRRTVAEVDLVTDSEDETEHPSQFLQRELSYDAHYSLRTHSENGDATDIQTQEDETEHPSQFLQRELSYDAHYSLRTHSVNGDATDIQTQVWQCLFEPDPFDHCKNTGIVVTCGGSSICFTRVKDGEVLVKFDQPYAEEPPDLEFTSMAWTTMSSDPTGNQRRNILAVGGTESKVILLDPEAGAFLGSFFTLHRGSTCIVTSLVFHPKNASWVICGHDNGHIQIWDIGIPACDFSCERLRTIAPPLGISHVYNMIFSKGHELLMVGYDGGLFAWDCPIGECTMNGWMFITHFHLPGVEDVGSRVDTLCLLQDDLVAVKCAGSRYIYIFAISEVLRTIHSKTKGVDNSFELTVPASKILKLKWSETGIRCMSMGADQISCLLVCGDDGGTVVVYNLAPYVNGKVNSPLRGGNPIDPVRPSLILPWPQPEDKVLEQAKNLQLTAHGTRMNGIAVSPGGRYIVAGTSNNLVCIWESSEAKSKSLGQRGISQ